MTPVIFGIVNITEDSFSDGGCYLEPTAAIEHACALANDGADVLDLGAAASNPDAGQVSPDDEIARLQPVIEALKHDGRAISIDSFSPDVQRWASSQRVDYLNDIHGFPNAHIYPLLAESAAKLIVMHSAHPAGRAQKIDVPPNQIVDRVRRFFERRIADLETAGIQRSRLILDPGMGFFVGSNPETSLEVLRNLPALKSAFGLPLLTSVSRKSFLRAVTGCTVDKAGAATLAAELFAVEQGADYIRTHDPAGLRDALAIQRALAGQAPLA
jgi:dihydropteroate synthase type 2